MKKKILLLTAASVALTICFSLQGQVVTRADRETHDFLREWVFYLASDNMGGRANGSPQMHEAADFIASVFRGAGLLPGFGDSYIREYSFSMRNRIIDERNVAAIIPGTSPALKDQYIVLSAHFDHIGIGRPFDGDSIYNGADDNATGVATLMALAKKIREEGIKPGRTLVFVAVSGEEMGMRGSRNFVSDPPIDLKKVFMNINFEMLGYNKNIGKKKFYMTGESQTNIDDFIRSFTHQSGWQLYSEYESAERLFGSSDNISFANIEKREDILAGIPSTTLCTHTGEDHIHKPWDEPQRIDYENMTGFINYLTDFVIWLSNSKDEIVWTNPRYVRY